MKRCQCSESDLETPEDMPYLTLCKSCGGWFALRLASVADLEKVRALLDGNGNYGGTD